MMRALFLCLVMLCWLLPAFGQSPTSPLPKEQFSDTTSFWYKWAREREKQIDIQPIQASTHPFHFRLSGTGGMILDVWQQDNQFQGSLTMWVKQVDDALGKLERIYSQQYKLSPSQAATIGQLIKKSGIIELPSEEHIQGWEQGLDGVEIVVQYIDNTIYRLKNYWTPSAQKELAEALLVQQFDTKAFELANTKLVRTNFQSGIPFQCYTADGSTATCKIVTTNTEYWQYKREVSRYLRQHKKNN